MISVDERKILSYFFLLSLVILQLMVETVDYFFISGRCRASRGRERRRLTRADTHTHTHTHVHTHTPPPNILQLTMKMAAV